jgi:hypothetical protein
MDGEDAINKQEEEEEEEVKVPEESKVGKKLSDLTTRRVILLVLAMMFSVPLFTISTYQEENNSFTFGLELIAAFNKAGQYAGAKTAYESYISEHLDIRTPLILVTVPWTDPATGMPGKLQKDDFGINANDLRITEKELVAI